MGVGLAAFVWGLAEATVFFIVPDVLLSFVALRSLRRAFTCCLLALAGALLGGVGMYWLGQQWPEAMTRLLDRIPAIAPPMLARVARELADSGALAIMLGPLSGTPYKAYAVDRKSVV